MSQKNIQTVRDIYAAFMRGDVPAIMQHISDDLQGFGVVSERKLLPWHIQVDRKQDVPEFFQALADSSEFARFEPRDFAGSDEHVYCTVSRQENSQPAREGARPCRELRHLSPQAGRKRGEAARAARASRLHQLCELFLDAHFSSAAISAHSPEVENFTTGGAILVAARSGVSAISNPPLSMAPCSCRGSISKLFSKESLFGSIVRSIRLSPSLARSIGGERLSLVVSSWR